MMNLSLLAGNAPLKAQLSDQFSRRGLSHAYIIAGPPLSGKRTLASLLAAAFVCSSGASEKPCLTCPHCRKAMGRIHPDVIWTGQEEKSLTVDAVRALRAQAYIRPNEAPRKVFVLERAQTMNPSAQNALLKLLEEGPSYAAFLLLTDSPAALLQTVRSRCETLSLSPLSHREVREALADRFPDASPQALQAAAADCEGILGRAVAALSGEDGPSLPRTTAPLLVRRMAEGDELALLEFTLTLEQWAREDLSSLFSETILLLRSALALRQGGVCDEREADRLAAVRAASALQSRSLVAAMELLTRLRTAAGFNASPAHLMGWLCAAVGDSVIS